MKASEASHKALMYSASIIDRKDRELQRDTRSIDRNSFIFKYNTYLLEFFGCILRLDLIGEAHYSRGTTNYFHSHVARDKLRIASRQQSWLSKWSVARRKSWWFWCPELILAVYVICNLHIVVYLYYQYSYDFNLHRLGQIQTFVSTTRSEELKINRIGQSAATSSETIGHLKAELSRKLTELRDILWIIGGQHYHYLSFMLEQMYLLTAFVAFLCYFALLVYYQLFTPFDCYTVRDVIDYENEESKVRDMIDNIIIEYCRSWRIFHMIKKFSHQFGQTPVCDLDEIEDSADGSSSFRSLQLNSNSTESRYSRNARIWPNELAKQAEYEQWQFGMSNSCEQLRLLRREAALRPFNRAAKWIEKRMLGQFLYFNWCIFYGTLLFVIIISRLLTNDEVVKLSKSNSIREQQNFPWLQLFELIFLGALAILSATFYDVSFCIRTVDQIVLVKKIRRLINSCIQINTMILNSKSDFAKRADEIEQINMNALLALMHFKIFVAALNGGVRKSFNIYIISLILMLIFPIIFGFHSSFMSQKWANQNMAIICSCIILAPADLTMIPLSHLHSRCLDLYKSMTSLLAHTIEVNEIVKISGQYSPIYDEHTVAILRKELDHPQQLQNRFATKSMGIACTYPLICKAHFWFGLILLSIVIGKQTSDRPEILTGFFSGYL